MFVCSLSGRRRGRSDRALMHIHSTLVHSPLSSFDRHPLHLPKNLAIRTQPWTTTTTHSTKSSRGLGKEGRSEREGKRAQTQESDNAMDSAGTQHSRGPTRNLGAKSQSQLRTDGRTSTVSSKRKSPPLFGESLSKHGRFGGSAGV